MPGVELILVSFLCVGLLFIPLPWHWRARNIATLSTTAWLVVLNIIHIVNSIAWFKNYEIRMHVWCDISTKIYIGAQIALPATALCICRRLEAAASIRQAHSYMVDKRKRDIFDLFMCFGVPIIIMALHYIVQGHRFDIFESYGCYPSTYLSWQAILIIWIPPLVMSVATFVYATLALRWFIYRRLQFATVLRNKGSGLTTSSYLRLMGLAVSQMVWGTSISAYVLYVNIHDYGLRPYISWADVHSNFSRIVRFPLILMPDKVYSLTAMSWWVTPATTFMFVLFFGFGEEAVMEYRKNIIWFRRTVLRQTVNESSIGSLGSFPAIKSIGLASNQVNVKLPANETSSAPAYDPKWNDTAAHALQPLPPALVAKQDDSDMYSPPTSAQLDGFTHPRSDLEANTPSSGPDDGNRVQYTVERQVV